MSYILRMIRRNRWSLTYDLPKYAEDAPADVLTDFATRGNELSFWLVDSERTNLDRLVSALAANRDRLDVLDYVLFDDVIFEQAGIPTELSPGDTLDGTVNQWHIAVKDISVGELAKLAIYIWRSPTKVIDRYLEKRLATMIIQSNDNGHLNIYDLKRGIQDEIQKYISR